MNETIIRQYAKKAVKDYTNEFYNFFFILLNNLIDIDIDKNLKLVFINYLMFERNIVFYKDEENELQIARISRCLTRDKNLLPLDIMVRTIDGTSTELLKEEYVLMYNPIPIDYLQLKIKEIANIERIIQFLRQLYKVPVIFQSKDSKALKAIKDFISKIFSYDEVCTVVNDGFESSKKIEKIDIRPEYITDKLLEENESLKEDILEILGIYKNTSGNRERVNETELIVSNSLTTVNKLGIENALHSLVEDINTLCKSTYTVELNINKIFSAFSKEDTTNQEDTADKGGEVK